MESPLPEPGALTLWLSFEPAHGPFPEGCTGLMSSSGFWTLGRLMDETKGPLPLTEGGPKGEKSVIFLPSSSSGGLGPTMVGFEGLRMIGGGGERGGGGLSPEKTNLLSSTTGGPNDGKPIIFLSIS